MLLRDKDLKLDKEPQKEVVPQLPAAPKWPAGIQFSTHRQPEVAIAKDLAVVVTHHAFEQLFGWSYATNREISCLGSIRRDGNRFIIEEFYLLKQTGSNVSTELDQTAMAELMEKLLAEGKHEEARSIKCWAHSHPGMGVFWSGTDDQTCRLIVSDYLVSVVVSDTFAIRCRIDMAAPVPITIDHVPVLYELGYDEKRQEKYAQDVKEAVSERFFFFDDFDDLRADKLDPTTKDKSQKHDYEYVPALYCNCCGNFHGDGECPLTDESQLAQMIEEDEFFI
jgi:proteasome lid subunit RPN8/RPN11